MHPLIVIVGPTASGKSDLALSLAERFNGEIVNYDSIQVFRGFDIGSAKPSLEERRRIPHHMIDIREPADLFIMVLLLPVQLTARGADGEGCIQIDQKIRSSNFLPHSLHIGVFLRDMTAAISIFFKAGDQRGFA